MPINISFVVRVETLKKMQKLEVAFTLSVYSRSVSLRSTHNMSSVSLSEEEEEEEENDGERKVGSEREGEDEEDDETSQFQVSADFFDECYHEIRSL